MIKKILLGAAIFFGLSTSAFAQATTRLCYMVQVGSTWTCTDVSEANPLPVSATVSASISPFTPGLSGARGTPLSVTTGDSSGNLPTNAGSVVVANVGANPMYCNVNGITATTSDQLITSGGGWFNFGIPAAITTLHCIATGGSTTANTLGGSGLGAGTGGGSGGGGGLSVVDQSAWTQGTSPFTPNGGIFNDTATLSSGQEGTARLTTKRAQIVDVDSTGNQLHSDLIAPIAPQVSHGQLIGAVEGQTASGVTPTENPLYNGGLAKSVNPTAVADGQKVASLNDLVGKRVTSPYAMRESQLRGSVTSTDTSAHTIIAAQGSSVKIYVTDIEISRSDAGTAAITVTLNDSATSPFVIPNNGGGGGREIHLQVPLAVAANTALTCTSGTSTTTVTCNAQGFAGY